ncbi:MAG: ABC transporter substrate-binding protein [Candidatus Sericytochromatia bacterium]
MLRLRIPRGCNTAAGSRSAGQAARVAQRRPWQLLSLGAFSALLLSCQSASPPPDLAFRCSGSWFIPPSFHGNAWSQGGDGTHLPFVYEPLFLYQAADRRYLPQLGLDYRMAPDRLSLTVRLRPTARWHDGTPFTSADVKSSFLLYWLQGWGGALKAIETPTPQSVVFHWQRPFNPVEERQMLGQRIQAPAHLFGQWTRAAEKVLARVPYRPAGGPALTPAEQKAHEQLLLDKSELLQQAYAFRPEQPVGTNAYKVAQVTASEMVLKRYPQSWHPNVKVPEVRILRGSTNDVMWAYLLGGDVDASHAATPPDVADQMRKLNPHLKQLNLPDYLNFGYVFNLRQAPFNDLRFRQAMAHLIDRDRLRQIASFYSLTSDDRHLPLMQQDAADWLSPGLENKLTRYPHDPARAEALLTEAGYTRNAEGRWLTPRGESIALEIAVIAGYSDWVLASESLTSQLTRFGIPAQVRTYDGALYHQLIRNGEFTMAAAFGLDYKVYTQPAFSMDRLFAPNGFLSKAAGLPPRLAGPDGQAVDLQKAVETLMDNADPAISRPALDKLLWLANRQLHFLAVYEKRIGVFVQEGERIQNWPAAADPVWSLTAQGLDATYAYLLSSGRLKPVAPPEASL